MQKNIFFGQGDFKFRFVPELIQAKIPAEYTKNAVEWQKSVNNETHI